MCTNVKISCKLFSVNFPFFLTGMIANRKVFVSVYRIPERKLWYGKKNQKRNQ